VNTRRTPDGPAARLLSAGNTVDPAEGYRAFRGRDAGIGALMRHRGFPEPASAPVSTSCGVR